MVGFFRVVHVEWHVSAQLDSLKTRWLHLFLAGLAIAAVALAGRYGIQAWHAFKTRPPTARMHKFYDGGFQPHMTRRGAALILGVRENATSDMVKEAQRRVIVANHPVVAITLLRKSMKLKM